jgi:hypothetical protein
LEIALSRGDEQFVVGKFSKTIIQRALAYASDGRPCTVTILNMSQLVDVQKIALHPALVDTQIGADAIALDSFAFHFIKSDPEMEAWWKDVQASVQDQNDIYSLARIIRIMGANNDPEDRFLQATTKFVNGADKARKDFLARGDEALSVLKKKSEFYDPDLVNWICDSARVTTNLKEFCANLAALARSKVETIDERGIKRWNADPPNFSWVSGVRENPFLVDKQLNFLRQGDRQSRFWPLEFVLQVAFTGAPAFLPTNVDATNYADTNPRIVPGSEDKLKHLFEKNLASDSTAASVMKRMQDFTVLQRLFRTGLAGKLGPAFPIERLADLVKASTKDDYVQTYRWIDTHFQVEKLLLNRIEEDVDSMTGLGTSAAAVDKRNKAIAVFKQCLESFKQNKVSTSVDIAERFNLLDLQRAADGIQLINDPQERSMRLKEAAIADELVMFGKYHQLRTALKIDSQSGDFASSTVQRNAR